MHTHKAGLGKHGPGPLPVTLSDIPGLQLPWWTALTSTIAGWSRGPGHAVNRAPMAEVERSRARLSAGRLMGRRYWPVGGNWAYPDKRKHR